MSSEPDRRLWIGHCWLCGSAWAEVLTRDSERVPTRVCRITDKEAKRIVMVRVSGRTSDVTLCGACEPTPDRMSELHATLCTRYRLSDAPFTKDGQRKQTSAQRLTLAAHQALFQHDVPLGEITRRPLVEVA